jgi:DNA polymerase
LLTELLAGVGLSRRDVYITNVVKCRPPENRDPQADEIQECRPYLEEQIAVIDPDVVVSLGRFALEFFLPGERISRIHGRPRRLGARTYLPMLHPAAALHQPSWRRDLDRDFVALGETLARASAPAPPESVPDDPGAQPTLF